MIGRGRITDIPSMSFSSSIVFISEANASRSSTPPTCSGRGAMASEQRISECSCVTAQRKGNRSSWGTWGRKGGGGRETAVPRE